MKRGGGGERQTERPAKVEERNKNKCMHAWEYPCLLRGALGKVDADGTGMGKCVGGWVLAG